MACGAAGEGREVVLGGVRGGWGTWGGGRLRGVVGSAPGGGKWGLGSGWMAG